MRLIERLHRIIAVERAPAPVKPRAPHPVRNPSLIARGFSDPRQRPGTKRVVITLDDADFERVRAYATRRNMTFAAAVRELINKNCGDSSTRERRTSSPEVAGESPAPRSKQTTGRT